jgi:transposase-like protein
MHQLKKAIGDLPVLAICFDACKGLENVVKNVFPNAEQKECFYHMVRNFKKRYRGFGMIYPAARAYTKDIFYDNIAKMLSESEAVVQWLRTNHNLLWYRCGFNLEIKCEYITSNIAESFNNWIRDHKDLPVADLVDKIREMIMVLRNKRRNIAYRLPEGRIFPAIMVQLRANTRGLGHLRVVTCSN